MQNGKAFGAAFQIHPAGRQMHFPAADRIAKNKHYPKRYRVNPCIRKPCANQVRPRGVLECLYVIYEIYAIKYRYIFVLLKCLPLFSILLPHQRKAPL
jgi:hypothetical protein